MPRHHSELLETGKHYKIEMNPGTLVRGRVVADGKPVANHVVGIYPDQMQDFHGRLFTRSRKIATDENGQFEFVGTRANVKWNIYSMMSNENGLIETEEFESGDAHKTRDLGEFELLPKKTIRGVFKMKDGSALPKKARVFLSRDYAWDYRSVLLKEDGKFEFQVPANELVEISFQADGVGLAGVGNKFQVKDERSFRACLDKDVKEYEVWLEAK